MLETGVEKDYGPAAGETAEQYEWSAVRVMEVAEIRAVHAIPLAEWASIVAEAGVFEDLNESGGNHVTWDFHVAVSRRQPRQVAHLMRAMSAQAALADCRAEAVYQSVLSFLIDALSPESPRAARPPAPGVPPYTALENVDGTRRYRDAALSGIPIITG